jgi:hypothetical protein
MVTQHRFAFVTFLTVYLITPIAPIICFQSFGAERYDFMRSAGRDTFKTHDIVRKVWVGGVISSRGLEVWCIPCHIQQ